MRISKKQQAALAQQPDTLQQLKHFQTKCTCSASRPPKPKLPAGTRRLKVQPNHVRRLGYYTPVPMILLKGVWLRKAGFDCQSHVIIKERKGELVIRVE